MQRHPLASGLAMLLLAALLIFVVYLNFRVDQLDSRTSSTMSVLQITRPGQPTVVFAQKAGEPWSNVLRRAKAAMDEDVAEGFEPKSTEWTGSGGIQYEVITYTEQGESMDEFCKRHDEEVRAAQELFPPVPQ